MMWKLKGVDVEVVEWSTTKEIETMGRAIREELEVKETAAKLQEGVYGATELLDWRWLA
jgi:hypothetical protein